MSDEQEIRYLFNNWIKSTTEGNLELARQCIADDAVFFVPGVGEMDKETFAQAAAGGQTCRGVPLAVGGVELHHSAWALDRAVCVPTV